MPLPAGTRFGPYEVIALIGAGGMGEVYRARDSRLDRDVALKLLPEAFSADPDRIARFDREAKALAALSHPNIAAIYDSGSRLQAKEGDTTPGVFLVMELVEGEDLSASIARGPMPLADALPIARQIADALEAAHESGIVHRDLKPANVKVRPDGAVKVLDFGLAKAMGADASGADSPSTSPTLTARATQMGMIIGTAAYMAPEQARGRAVDRRADIWAFGVVLYEMLAGRRAFEGDDISITLASVLKEDVAWDALPADLPPAVRTLLRRCLEKDPKRRLGWIGEARHTLEDPHALSSLSMGRTAGDSGAQHAVAPAATSPWRRAVAAAAAISLAATAALAAWMLKPAPPPGIVGRFEMPLATDVGFSRSGRRNVAISPDGRRIAFIANQQIYLRQMHETEAQPIRGSNVDPAELAFSPEGDWLAFFVPAAIQGPLDKAVLKKLPVTGGTPMEITPADAPYGLRWQGDTLVFSTGDAIMTVAAAGGASRTLITASKDPQETLAQAQLLNGGRDVLYSVRTSGSTFNDARIIVRPAAGGEPKVLVNGGSDGRVLPTGHLVYVRDNTLLAQPFDEGRLELRGSAVPVVERVRFTQASGAGQFDVAANGTLVFAPGTSDAAFRMVWVDRTGRETAIAADAMLYYLPRVSPDGTMVAVSTATTDNRDIWIWNDARKRMTRFTSDAGEESYPVWAPDSKSLYYRANPKGNFDVFRRAVEGAGAPEPLSDAPGAESPLSLFAAGQQLLVRAGQLVQSADSLLMTLSATAASKPEPLVAPVIVPSVAEVSPDGRWLLYQAVESSTQEEVWVRPFPGVDGGRWQVSPGGGTRPTWSRSGREIFYRARDGANFKLVSVPVLPAAAGKFEFGAPVPLFDVSRYSFLSVGRTYDVAPGDQRFVFLSTQTADASGEGRLTIIVNWLDDLRARVR